MRRQDPIPDWTTHLALIHKDGTVQTGKKDDVLRAPSSGALHYGWKPAEVASSGNEGHEGQELVSLSGVSVAYGDRKVY